MGDVASCLIALFIFIVENSESISKIGRGHFPGFFGSEARSFSEEYRGLLKKKSGLRAEKDGKGRGLFTPRLFLRWILNFSHDRERGHFVGLAERIVAENDRLPLLFLPILWYNKAMENWSTDTEELKKNPESYTIWKLEQTVNFGLGTGEKINERDLRKYFDRIQLDPDRKKLFQLPS